MRWQDMRPSSNVEDRRGAGSRVMVGGGIGTLVVILLALFFGVDASMFLGGGGGLPLPADPGASGPTSPAETERAQLVQAVLGSTEDVWHEQFRRLGRHYQEPTLVLFSGQVRSACGFADAAVGPFYCPGDAQVYIDLSFYDDLDRLGAPGDFAQAYVVAHEIGHHVQNLLGVSDQMHEARGRLSEREYNELSVRLELQADFYAGLWAHHAQKARPVLEPGDIEEGLRASAAIGDDRLQKRSRGYVVPDSFTHGTSEQRVRWFRRGLETGDIRQGDTFAVDRP
jgi:hypothetical protein